MDSVLGEVKSFINYKNSTANNNNNYNNTAVDYYSRLYVPCCWRGEVVSLADGDTSRFFIK